MLPGFEDLNKVIRWAYEPQVVYVAGYKYDDGVGVFAGPDPSLDNLLGIDPEEHPEGSKAYIIKYTKTTFLGEPLSEPVARWHGGRWQRKKETKE